MVEIIKTNIYNLLRWSEKWAKTDMVYLAHGGFWMMFGRIGIFLISFAKMYFFGKYFTQEQYGVYTYLISMMTLLTIFSLPEVNTALVKAIALNRDGSLKIAVREKFKWALIGSFLALVVAVWYFINFNNYLGLAFILISILMPAVVVFPVYLVFWHGKKNFRALNLYELLGAFLAALVSIPVLIITGDPLLTLGSLLLAEGLIYYIFYRFTLKQTQNNEIDEDFISFGKNLTVMNALVYFANELDKIIVWKMLGPIPLAIYTFALLPINKIKTALPIYHLALPKLGEKDIVDMKEGIISKFYKLLLAMIPLVLIIYFSAPYLYKFVFPQYLDSVSYFQMLSLLLLFLPFTLFHTALVVSLRKKELYIIRLISPFTKILLTIILVPMWHIWGVVLALLLSSLLSNILNFYYFKKI
ncbi:MAG TPA: hypothetical protein ENN31_00595 [Candidatus Vogelbacteria bacterium]|nr:hypothetical protein [Candidatus Vogelbacteria bacterium]